MSCSILDLRMFEPLESVPESELNWLIKRAEYRELEEGAFLFKKDDPADEMFLIIEGEAVFYMLQNGERRDFGSVKKGSITGLLPYSRMTHASGYGIVTKPVRLLAVCRKDLRDLIVECPEITTALVHHMTSRVRDFTSTQQQVYQLAALGKLSARLAHELNNPAAAIVRSADSLKEYLGHVPDRFKKVISLQLPEEAIDSLNEFTSRKIEAGVRDIGLLERNDLEDELFDWLDDHDISYGDEWVEQLVDFDVRIEELEKICETTGAKALGPTLGWLVNVLTTEKMVDEIKDASKRISELVQSVKTYSHMDQSTDRQLLDSLEGLRNTVRMLGHKARRFQIKIREDFDPNTGKVLIYPSEMNQVWTNLLDNGLDALEGKVDNPQITLKTGRHSQTLDISIVDNGPGIPLEVQDQIFNPFFTTKAMGKGTGLGLDVVKRTIDRHGGRIELDSVVGRTEFKIVLPTN